MRKWLNNGSVIRANLLLGNAVVFDVNTFEIKKGESFRIELKHVSSGTPRWFADNDPVLRIVEDKDGMAATFKATELGKSEIHISIGGVVVKRIFVEVYALMATSLGITFGLEEPK